MDNLVASECSLICLYLNHTVNFLLYCIGGKTFRDEFKELLTEYDVEPVDCLVYVKLDFFVQIPKSWSKKKKAEKDNTLCDNNADIDNYVKAALDSLEGKYYKNDKQIAMIRARKYWSTNGSIKFSMEKIDE